jgi:hypothetical protein
MLTTVFFTNDNSCQAQTILRCGLMTTDSPGLVKGSFLESRPGHALLSKGNHPRLLPPLHTIAEESVLKRFFFRWRDHADGWEWGSLQSQFCNTTLKCPRRQDAQPCQTGSKQSNHVPSHRKYLN